MDDRHEKTTPEPAALNNSEIMRQLLETNRTLTDLLVRQKEPQHSSDKDITAVTQDEYRGKSPKEYREWMRQVSRFSRMKEHIYSTDYRKVEFAAQFLKGTIATLWNQHYDRQERQGKDLAWSEFAEFLRDKLENPRHRGFNAVRWLNSLEQREGQHVQDFQAVFEEAVGNLDVPEEWFANEKYWAQLFRSKLRKDVQYKIENFTHIPDHIDEML